MNPGGVSSRILLCLHSYDHFVPTMCLTQIDTFEPHMHSAYELCFQKTGLPNASDPVCCRQVPRTQVQKAENNLRCGALTIYSVLFNAVNSACCANQRISQRFGHREEKA